MKILPKVTIDDWKSFKLGAQEALARKSYADYFLLANPTAKMYPHIQIICDALQKIIDGEQHFYIIEMPPRHGKSLAITKTFASYYMMKFPEREVMITAYSEKLYKQFSGDERRKFKEWGPRLYGLTTSIDSADEFQIKGHRGKFHATSMTGGATGMGADLLIIDDPVKNAIEASSPTIKERIWNEWTDTFSTRVQGQNASVIVIMTRWQTDDLAGRLLQEKAFPWEEIKLPAIAELPPGKTDIIGRHNGEALCSERMTIEQLRRQKQNMGTMRFNALYQQSPTIESGNIFKRSWVRYYVPDRVTMNRLGLTEKDVAIMPRHFDEQVQAWDATFKSKANDDFVAGQTWARRGANCYLLPGWCHKRLSFTETLDAIREQTRRYPQAITKLVEDKANGPAIIDTLQREIVGIMPVSPGADSKEARASSVSPQWEAGQVFVPHPLWKPEIEDWLETVLGFPNMPHDDDVDSMVYALIRLNTRNQGEVIRF